MGDRRKNQGLGCAIRPEVNSSPKDREFSDISGRPALHDFEMVTRRRNVVLAFGVAALLCASIQNPSNSRQAVAMP